MMSTTSSLFRTAALLTLLLLVPTAAVAQGRKSKPPRINRAPAAAAPIQHRAATPMKSPNGVHAKTINNNIPVATNESLVSSLHSTLTPLIRAENEYNGRRGRAMTEINNAIKLLNIQLKPGNTALAQSGIEKGAITPFRAGTGPKMTPEASDARLREAQQSLQNIESQMSPNGVNSHQFTQARDSVQNAIRELNLALINQ